MSLAVAVLLLAPMVAPAQAPDAGVTAAALRYVASAYDPATGGYRPTPAGKPGLRATNAGVKATKSLGGRLPDEAKTRAFVLGCFDPAAGGFADAPGGKPDVTTTAVGVMAAVEVGVPKEKFRGAMGYLREHARTFEEVRIGAAAVEAWGVGECPFDVGPWVEAARAEGRKKPPAARDGGARLAGSWAALVLRLGRPLGADTVVAETLAAGQRPDGGWAKPGADGSDAESTYRVMRALTPLKVPPKDPAGVRKFLLSCRTPDGGFGTQPGEPSGVGGVYYYAIITKWLDGMK